MQFEHHSIISIYSKQFNLVRVEVDPEPTSAHELRSRSTPWPAGHHLHYSTHMRVRKDLPTQGKPIWTQEE